MACSTCGNSLYSCNVAAGAGITITGNGTLSDPFVITNTGDSTGSVTCDAVTACLAGGGYVQAVGTAADGDILVWDNTAGAWNRSQNRLRSSVGGTKLNVITATDNVTPELDVAPATTQTANAVQVRPGAGTNASFAVNSAGYLRMTSQAAADVPVVVKGTSAQTGHLQEWQNSAGTVVGSIAADGTVAAPNVGPAPVYAQTTAPVAPIAGTVWIDTSGAAT